MAKQEKQKTEQKTIVGTRGREFQGNVTKVFSDRIVIEFSRPVYVRKYERFWNKKTRIHARLPEGNEVQVGDLVVVKECRPLSKIIHHVFIRKVEESR